MKMIFSYCSMTIVPAEFELMGLPRVHFAEIGAYSKSNGHVVREADT